MHENYKELFNFLGAWFPDMDFEDLTEKDIVKEYKRTVSQEELNTVVSQAEEVRDKIGDDWKFLSEYTNVYFEDSRAAISWINLIISLLKK